MTLEMTYHRLIIDAEAPTTEIWLGDDKGFLVSKSVGRLTIGIKPGYYMVEFTLGGLCYPLRINADQHLSEAQVRQAPPQPRPMPNIDIVP